MSVKAYCTTCWKRDAQDWYTEYSDGDYYIPMIFPSTYRVQDTDLFEKEPYTGRLL